MSSTTPSEDTNTSRLERWAILGLLSGTAAYIIYQTYQKRQKQKIMDYSMSESLTCSSAKEWNHEILPPPPKELTHAISQSIKKTAKQTGFQKYPSKQSNSQLLLTASKFNLSASASSLKSSDTNLTELDPAIRNKPFLLTRQATQPKLDLSPTFLGESSYRETVIFLLGLATFRLFPDQELIVQNTFKFGTSRRTYFCSFTRSSNFIFTEEIMAKIEAEMKALSAMKLELTSKFIDYATCLTMLTSTNQLLSARLVESLNRPCYRMVGCDIDDDDTSYYILQYRSTLNNTKYCHRFSLHVSDDNKHHFIVKFPHKENELDGSSKKLSGSSSVSLVSDNNDGEYKENEWRQPQAIRELYQQGLKMSEFLEINSVADINDVIRVGRFKELMLVSEAYHNRQIVKISNKIRAKSKCKIVLISGPSSSGKTTFASKLAIQLRLLGMVPTVMEVDMFYRDRTDPLHPRDSKGNLNFEVIEAVKVDEFNQTINRLLDGEEVKIPNFDFKTGSRNGFQKEPLKLDKKKGVLVMEGIFCLNPKLLLNVQGIEDIAFKIFICPISPFYALDNFHFISEQVMRLIRRISRDHFHRGKEAEQTVFKWGQLKEGEDINIFPYVKYADAVFNSSLLYELSVLKVYSYPLLQTVISKSKQYKDAQNLIAFLDMFFSMPDRHVPSDSLLMEFIGKSIFDEIE